MIIPKEAAICPHCKKKQGTGLIVKLILAFLLFGVINAIIQKPLPEPPPSSQPLSPPSSNDHNLTPAEHLKAIQVNLKTGNIVEANLHFRKLSQGTQEFSKAEKLYDNYRKNKKIVDRESAKIANQVMIQKRAKFAKEYERQLLDKGMDVYVSTQGKDKSVLRVKWVLVSRPLVYKMINDGSVMGNLRNLGFKKLIMTDGYDSSWTVKVE
jgi:RNA polymerase subunit RPABC4/transcription elongation factor Spt4